MAGFDFYLDGRYGGYLSDFSTYNGVSDTVNIHISETSMDGGFGAGGTGYYSLGGDLYSVEDSFRLIMPTGWYVYADYEGMAGETTNHYMLIADAGGVVRGTLVFTGVIHHCFTKGAMIETPSGPMPIENLQVGDLVETKDHGAQQIRWIGSSIITGETLAQFPEMRPIRINAGALGDNETQLVSPAHRMLLNNWQAETLFGKPEVLASARSLINDHSITVAHDINEVEYFHVLFDNHEIIHVDGAWSESFHPSGLGNDPASRATRAEVLALFPDLDDQAQKPTARATLCDKDVSVIWE